jgi:parallel beta-helix repeat protein
MSKLASLGGAALAAALALIASPALASAPTTTVACGQTLTHSVRLANDLTNCSGHGLVIGADGITVDLNGHTIDGTVTPTDCDRPEPGEFRNGIQNDGNDRVTIFNGTIRQFDTGVSAGSDDSGMSDSRVHDLTLVDNRFNGVGIGSGAGPAATADNLIDHNVVSSDGPCSGGLKHNTGDRNRFIDNRIDHVGDVGIVICCGGTGNVAQGNTVSHTGHDGILVFVNPRTRIADNTISDVGGDEAIALFGNSSGSVIEGNTILRAHGAAMVVARCDECQGEDGAVPTGIEVSRNDVSETADGILLFEIDRAVVRRNTAMGVGTFGDQEALGVGIGLGADTDALVSRNTATGGRGPGVMIGDPPQFDPGLPVTGNTVERNTVAHNGADGIVVNQQARDTTVERNTASDNGGDGIHVLSPFTTLTANTADRNALLGIEAVAGVIDGGHNEASSNGNPAQCTGVACS